VSIKSGTLHESRTERREVHPPAGVEMAPHSGRRSRASAHPGHRHRVEPEIPRPTLRPRLHPPGYEAALRRLAGKLIGQPHYRLVHRCHYDTSRDRPTLLRCQHEGEGTSSKGSCYCDCSLTPQPLQHHPHRHPSAWATCPSSTRRGPRCRAGPRQSGGVPQWHWWHARRGVGATAPCGRPQCGLG
jgi:hypothetical protein